MKPCTVVFHAAGVLQTLPHSFKVMQTSQGTLADFATRTLCLAKIRNLLRACHVGWTPFRDHPINLGTTTRRLAYASTSGPRASTE